ncbi:MAG: iron-sulfur cluster assembly accessory protein [Betaproteobacteria bacterium]|nr:iron-sulfur cluster assembly accessory protein [Betaproteobacteria bacterium]
MITVTSRAAEEIRQAASRSGVDDVALRVAAKETDDGELQFGMGFDEAREGDAVVELEGFVILIAQPSQAFLAGATLDLVDVDSGGRSFVFIPAQEAVSGGCGSSGCGSGCGGGCGS